MGGVFMNIKKTAGSTPAIKLRIFKTVRVLAVAAALTAMNIVFGKFLCLNLSRNFRISLGNLPVILSGFAFGPAIGFLTGLVGDLIGCVLMSYDINPIIALGSAVVGLVPGVFSLFWKIPADYAGKRIKNLCMIFCMVFTAHFMGSVIIKSIGLRMWYKTPYSVLIMRLPVAAVTAVIETYIVYQIYRHQMMRKLLSWDRGK